MIYSLMAYSYKRHFNVGDYIQSLAARQFLPRVDRYVNREKLNEYHGPETKMIMNGWFMLCPENWPPSPKINPLFISFHLNQAYAEKILDERGAAYLKKYKVGCRDNSTLNLLKAKGVDAFLSGCLTLTLGNSYKNSPGEDIYFVDVLFKFPTLQKVFRSFRNFRKSVKNREIFQLGRRKKLLCELFGEKIVKAAKNITHDYSSAEYPDEDSRFELAESLLKRYQKAKLVVTSRIHCALPCLAMGTPVIFIDGGFSSSSDRCRIEDMNRLFNTIYIEGEKITTNFNYEAVKKNAQVHSKTCHLEYIELLNQQCEKFISDNI